MTEDYRLLLADLSDLDAALAKLIARDRKLDVSDEEIVERIRKAVGDEALRRENLAKKELSQ